MRLVELWLSQALDGLVGGLELFSSGELVELFDGKVVNKQEKRDPQD